MANKWVYMFEEGDMTMRNLLGGKGSMAKSSAITQIRSLYLFVQAQELLCRV